MAARVPLRGGEKISRAAVGEGKESLFQAKGVGRYLKPGEEAESCGELARPSRLHVVSCTESLTAWHRPVVGRYVSGTDL